MWCWLQSLAQAVAQRLEKLGAVKRDANLFQLEPNVVGGSLPSVHDLLGQEPETFSVVCFKKSKTADITIGWHVLKR